MEEEGDFDAAAYEAIPADGGAEDRRETAENPCESDAALTTADQRGELDQLAEEAVAKDEITNQTQNDLNTKDDVLSQSRAEAWAEEPADEAQREDNTATVG